MAAPALRWGLLATGWIAERFLASLRDHTRQEVVAVGSRTQASADDFAARFGVPTAHGSYEALVSDPDVDIVYVATPHNGHLPAARLALEAGKHVLVEKPLTINAAEATELQALAAERGLFCMEALWTLFLPKFDVLRQLLADGALGDIHTVHADMGEHFAAGHRILRADLAGGPMLDLGTYPVSFADFVLGEPERVLALGQPHPAGVNGQTAAILADARGNQAVIQVTVSNFIPTTAFIAGTEGTVVLDGPFYQPGAFEVADLGGRTRLRWEEPAIAHGALYVSAVEAARCIADGRTESDIRPLADSIRTLRVMDEIRRQSGEIFAEER
jgi:predicted dehydrogenase